MTLSTDTIRTVIEIVPDWTATDHVCHTPLGLDNVYWDKMHPAILDALAAAAVRVVNSMEGYRVQCGDEQHLDRVLIFGPKFKAFHGYKIIDIEGPNRTENTLEAIAEFVKSGGFESE